MKSKRSIIAAALLGAMLLSVPIAASAATTTIAVESKPIVMEFDGKKLALPSGQAAFMYQSKVYIPLRFASYALQKQVEYDAKTKTVTVAEPTSGQKVALKEYLANAGASTGQAPAAAKVKLVPTTVKLVFDGVEKKLPAGQQAYNVNGSIYVPIRFIAEAVGTMVLWDAKTGTVSGESKAYRNVEANGERDGQSGSGAGSGNSGAANGNLGSGTGTGTGSSTNKPSYDSITSSAYSQLDALRSECVNKIFDLALAYKAASSAEKQTAIQAQALTEIDTCKAKFEVIIAATDAKLTSNGYSTDVLKEYRATFEAEMESGRKVLESMR
ncbi:copper amine oxidase N-terminal domain-containing protein [Cohnella sp. GCM10020058]|uniref:copper amine oxidase N-terminal domain-containing protein n=1 Tax=Cohnella sp. GCM10020058 TaxID=3317330 RepID=UPI00363F99DD